MSEVGMVGMVGMVGLVGLVGLVGEVKRKSGHSMTMLMLIRVSFL